MTTTYAYGTPPLFSGATLPPYYRPTPSVRNRNNYVPGAETLGPEEMRISFLGSTPWPPQRDQAGTCIMVELGPDKQFFFDFGNGCIRNYFAMQRPIQLVNDIFLSHLHVDHYADLPYLLPFRAWQATYKPLRVHGPSGRTPELGTKAMVAGMKQMLKWHLEAFDVCPIGDGYEVEVNEFDWKDENGVCYDKDGVVVRHWRRSHAKDGASAYRLEWNGLSMVWTGDGRPDELTAKYSKGVDVFITEGQMDAMNLMAIKYGMPAELSAYTLDTHHTPMYAGGLLMKEIAPRIAMCCHMEFDDVTMMESLAEVRVHYDGLFVYGGPDVMVANVTKDAVWCRKALLPDHVGVNMPTLEQMARVYGWDPERMPRSLELPRPRLPREEQQEQQTRDSEVDPKEYYPADILPMRPIINKWPAEGVRIDFEAMAKARQQQEEELKKAA